MKKQKKLLFARNIFFFFIIMIFTIIIMFEKKDTILIPKATKKIASYIEDKYNKDEFKLGSVSYKNNKYTMKVSSKDNNNRFFYIYYTKAGITDSYQNDYIKGESLLSNLKKDLEKSIKSIVNTKVTVEIPNTLDQYTDTVRKRILNEDNLLELKFYIIKEELLIKKWDPVEIEKQIEQCITKYTNSNITPKSFTIIINNDNEITESIEINNLTTDFINNPSKIEIINDILNDNNSILLKTNKITYVYKN